ncbi:universal stress protein, UspA [Methylorubrum populi]|uniref:Universal stress protein, UspA n=1 Tax=Methylorubrum populi TaxID=223967 RepID=A0A160PB32_9HYPH|nr:universal stress protein [Methylorubrum populi]BAU89989.1 universal stress protein, UspA [Methylorubrum populi]
MAYANILVSVDLDGTAPDRIRLAAGLARRFEATLTGAAACKVPAPDYVRDIGEIDDEDPRFEEKARAMLERARALFEQSAEAPLHRDWREALAGPITHLVGQARAADLLVVGRRGVDDAPFGALSVPPGPVLMEAARPILVVPPRTEHLRGARIVVAWKDGLEARRAVSAALPFIREADQVFVASTGEGARYEGAEDVAGHLARHGASVTTHLLRTAVSDSDELLRFALKQEADLIVMGAYGRTRLREWLFGGVTYEMLQRSPLPCLMCH